MKFSRYSEILFVLCSIFCLLSTSLVAKKNKNQTGKGSQVSGLKTSKVILAYAIDDIKESLSNSEGKFSAVCCTYKLKGTTVVSKEIKTRYQGYRMKPAYHKECFLNETTYHPDKIVQINFNKLSDKLLITHKDPNAKWRRIFSESMDVAQYDFAEQS